MYIIARTVHTAISRSEPPIWAATWAAEAAAVNAPNRAIGAWDASAPAGMFVHRDRGMGGGRGRADPAHAGSQGTVPSESTFRRTLQRLDADAFDDLAGAWAQRAVRPGPKKRRVIAVDGKTLRGLAGGGEPDEHLLAALDYAHGAVLGQVRDRRQDPRSPSCWTAWQSPGRSSPPTRRTPSAPTPPTWPSAARILVHGQAQPARLFAQLASLPQWQVPVAHYSASAATATMSTAPSKSPPSPGWPSRTPPPRPSRWCAAGGAAGERGGPARPSTRSPR